MNRREIVIALAGAGAILPVRTYAQTTANVPKYPDKLGIAEANAAQLMLLIDTDKNGKISKPEWMDFMSKEFDRLDTDKSGYLDPKELKTTYLTYNHVPTAVQGK